MRSAFIPWNKSRERHNMTKDKPKPPPPPDPPVTERSTEVQAARRQTQRDERKRKGQLSTLLAGETKGQPNTTKKTLLGGQ